MSSRRGPSEREFSAGGVVLEDDRVAVVVPTRRGAKGQLVLALPKGHVDPGETPAQAATREVKEETGLDAELKEKLGDVRYWYQRNGRRIFKVVTFYLFERTGGPFEAHGGEVGAGQWIALGEAASELSFPGEREMVAKALSRR